MAQEARLSLCRKMVTSSLPACAADRYGRCCRAKRLYEYNWAVCGCDCVLA